MISIQQTTYTKDATNKKLTIVREFDAPVELVWRAWTENELLDQWWAPRPYQTKTKCMDFREGGSWLYGVEGPDNFLKYTQADFQRITPPQSIIYKDMFCDEHGNPDNDLPKINWSIYFTATASGTSVQIAMIFDSEADLEKIIEMGFQEGFAGAHDNLDALLARQLMVGG